MAQTRKPVHRFSAGLTKPASAQHGGQWLLGRGRRTGGQWAIGGNPLDTLGRN